MKLISAPLLVIAIAVVAASCDPDRDAVEIVLVNVTPHDLTDLRLAEYHDTDYTVPGYSGVTFPADLPAGGQISVAVPASREFGWGDPAPTGIAATVDCGEARISNGYWCGTGYYTAPVDPGTYTFHLVEWSDTTARDPELRYVFVGIAGCADE